MEPVAQQHAFRSRCVEAINSPGHCSLALQKKLLHSKQSYIAETLFRKCIKDIRTLGCAKNSKK